MGVLLSALKNSLEVKIKKLALKKTLPAEEREELYNECIGMLEANGFHSVFVFNERAPIDWGSVIGLGLLAVGQIAAGTAAALFTVGAGMGLGISLVKHGFEDAITAFKDGIINRNFNWATWAMQKAISFTADLVCAGFNAIKSAASGLVRGVKVAINCTDEAVKTVTKNFFKSSTELIVTEAVKVVSKEVIIQVFDAALINTIQEPVTEAITDLVNSMFSEYFRNDPNIKILIECDKRNRNNKYAKKLEQKILKIIDADHNVFFQWGYSIRGFFDRCGILGKIAGFVAQHGEHIIVLERILVDLPKCVEEIAKSEECQDDCKKELPATDDKTARVKFRDITVDDFCRHCSSRIASRIILLMKKALIQTAASGIVDFAFGDWSSQNIAAKFQQQNMGICGNFVKNVDAKLEFGLSALKIEESIKTALNGGPADASQIEALAQVINRKIILNDGEKEYCFGNDSEKESIVLKYTQNGDDKVGHCELENGKTIQSSGKNNCLYDAIAAETGDDPKELQKRVANRMINDFPAFAELHKNSQWTSLRAGKKSSSYGKHFIRPEENLMTEFDNVVQMFPNVEKNRWHGKKGVEAVENYAEFEDQFIDVSDGFEYANGDKMYKRTIISLDPEILSPSVKSFHDNEIRKSLENPNAEYMVQLVGNYRGHKTIAYVGERNVRISISAVEHVIVSDPKFIVRNGELVHYVHENTKTVPRPYFSKTDDPNKIKIEFLRLKPK